MEEKIMNKRLCYAAAVVLCLIPLGAWAQEAQTQMADMVVTATRTETTLEKAGGSAVTVIDATDIAAKQLTTVEEILKTVPGLDVMATGGAGSQASVFLRGADAKNTLVLIDGVMVNDPSSTTRNANLANITADNIERIEIVRGPQSVLYGSNATAGVINIITKTGKGAPSVYADVEYGSYNTWKATGGTSGSVGDRFNWSFSASRTETDGFSMANDDNDDIAHAGNTDEDDGWENTTVSGKFGLNLTPDFDVSAVLRMTDSEVDQDDWGPGYAGDRFGGWPAYAAEPDGATEAVLETEEFYGRFSVHNFFADRFFESTAYVQMADTDRTVYDNDGAENYDYQGTSRDIGWQGSLNFSDINVLTFGVNLFLEEMESDSSMIDDADADTRSVFVQDQWFVGDALVLVAGVRLDDHDRFGSEATWRIAPSYTIGQTGTTVKATYGTGYRAPSLFELYSSYGNPDLEPETSQGWDLGVEQSVLDGRLRFGASYFALDFEDYIGWDYNLVVPGNLWPGGYNQLDGTTKTRGVEAFVSFSPLEVLDFSLNYTYTDTEDPDGEKLVRRPENKVAFNVQYRFLERGTVNADVLWVDERKAIDSAADVNGNPVDVLDDYVLVNLAASYDICRWLQIHARIDNLFDEAYEEAWSYATPGLSGYLGFTVRY